MRKVEMAIIENKQIAKDTIKMTLEDEYITQTARPGQFIYIALPNVILRRPISIADVNHEKNQLTIIFKTSGPGTARLADYSIHCTLDCIGPNGNGFPLDVFPTSCVLLIGGGVGVPPLYYLGQELRSRGVEVISILGFQTKEQVFYEEAFNRLGETFIVTDDGSYGRKGYVTDILHLVHHFDMYYSCGPRSMLKSLVDKLQDKAGYISLEERMGCGIGACSACVVQTTNKGTQQKICSDGPVFSSREVIL